MRAFVKKKPLRGDLTESSSCDETAPSTPPKGNLELGTLLVQQLELDDSTDTLGRWMAHHLAELMTAAADLGKSKVARAQASARAAKLILKIWKRRSHLPGDIYPLTQYRNVLEVLKPLSRDTIPWRPQITRSYQVLGSAIYQDLRTITIALLFIEPLLGKQRKANRSKHLEKFLPITEMKVLKEFESLVTSIGSKTADSSDDATPGKLREHLRNVVDRAISHLNELRQKLADAPPLDSASPRTSARKRT